MIRVITLILLFSSSVYANEFSIARCMLKLETQHGIKARLAFRLCTALKGSDYETRR